MKLAQQLGFSSAILGCVCGTFVDGIRILTVLATLALAGYMRDAREIDRATR